MKKFFSFIFLFLRLLIKSISAFATLFSSLLLFLFLIFIISLFFEQSSVEIPDSCALVINPSGEIVEEQSAIDPMARFINNAAGIPMPEETLLQDILDAVNKAANDDRIKLLVIAPNFMEQIGFNQLQVIGSAIEGFKQSGKAVVATGSHFNQSQYYLSSFADTIFLDPMGRVELKGMGLYRLYGRDLLDTMKVNFHTFKVGTYKSALEPFTRNSMSDEAKEANQLWLNKLWSNYRGEIARQRKLKPSDIDYIISETARLLQKTGGDFAQMALETKLVDGLKTDQEFKEYMKSQVGAGRKSKGFLQVDLAEYMSTVPRSYRLSDGKENKEQIALIFAHGNIIHGRSAPGQIGDMDLIAKINRAKEDNNIKALVLRIDSGGGSAFASEQIRRALLAFKSEGKPVVISMGSTAASGAYWLSADADSIIASPVTLTGSIGIFGAIPTFERSLAEIGVYGDSITTTPYGGSINLTRDLDTELSLVIQLGVENGYQQFLDIVANGRNMEIDKVAEIAEGRVWDGETAKDLGLVDQLGSLEDAVERAAALAGLTTYAPIRINNYRTPGEQFFARLRSNLAQLIHTDEHSLLSSPFAAKVTDEVNQYSFLFSKGDPSHVYAHSLLSRNALTF